MTSVDSMRNGVAAFTTSYNPTASYDPIAARAAPSATSASSNFGSAMSIASTAGDIAGILGSKAQEEDKVLAIRNTIGLAVADFYTGGLASFAYNAIHKLWPGLGKTLDKISVALDPVLKIVMGLFDTDRWKTEGNRLRDLLEKGIQIPEALQGALQLTRGRSKEELLDPSVALDFQGYKADGTWVNNKFAMSRNESDLRAEDIWGYAAFFEKFGNDWLGKFNADQRREIAELALKLGCVREHHGTMDITWRPELEQFAASLSRGA